MADWDPEAPDTIGLPWLPGSSGQKVISTPYQSIAWQFPSTATETVTDLLVSVDSIDTAGMWIAEVYEAGDEVGLGQVGWRSWAGVDGEGDRGSARGAGRTTSRGAARRSVARSVRDP